MRCVESVIQNPFPGCTITLFIINMYWCINKVLMTVTANKNVGVESSSKNEKCGYCEI